MTMNTILWGFGGAAIAVASIASGLVAGKMGAEGFAAEAPAVVASDRSDLETSIRDYLLANPEVLVEAQQVLASREQERQRMATLDALQSEQTALYESPHDGVIGNPDASTTIVEFFDYNCGYCKQALGDMEAMVEADSDLRFIVKEFPILGPDSQAAHVVSAAFLKVAPEKYAEFHVRLLGGSGRASEATALDLARDMDVEEAALREAMQDPALMDAFSKTYDLASRLQITGTPAYVIGNEVVFGALGSEALMEKVAAARQ